MRLDIGEAAMVTVEHVETRADLAAAMGYLAAECKALSRKGRIGTLDERYADLHANLDMLIESWLEAEDG